MCKNNMTLPENGRQSPWEKNPFVGPSYERETDGD
jgi:hypothetical protein